MNVSETQQDIDIRNIGEVGFRSGETQPTFAIVPAIGVTLVAAVLLSVNSVYHENENISLSCKILYHNFLRQARVYRLNY